MSVSHLPDLTLAALKLEAGTFAGVVSSRSFPDLFGVTDGKAVGTRIEQDFNQQLSLNYQFERGNSAAGIDFPSLLVDLKVTSIRQPQSSCPFRDASEKVYGLGYHLLIFVYEKRDDDLTQHSYLDFWINGLSEIIKQRWG
jgi:restriction system protein